MQRYVGWRRLYTNESKISNFLRGQLRKKDSISLGGVFETTRSGRLEGRERKGGCDDSPSTSKQPTPPHTSELLQGREEREDDC